jgi:hypothetical protein
MKRGCSKGARGRKVETKGETLSGCESGDDPNKLAQWNYFLLPRQLRFGWRRSKQIKRKPMLSELKQACLLSKAQLGTVPISNDLLFWKD